MEFQQLKVGFPIRESIIMNNRGTVWKFGDDISTDLITPGRYAHLLSDIPELSKHCLEDAREDFASEVEEGDYIVAGTGFGMGSSREHAPITIQYCGVAAIFAESFGRIFYRNAMNLGLPAITIDDSSSFQHKDEIDVDFQEGEISISDRNGSVSFDPIPPFMNELLESGGLISYLNEHEGQFEVEQG